MNPICDDVTVMCDSLELAVLTAENQFVICSLLIVSFSLCIHETPSPSPDLIVLLVCTYITTMCVYISPLCFVLSSLSQTASLNKTSHSSHIAFLIILSNTFNLISSTLYYCSDLVRAATAVDRLNICHTSTYLKPKLNRL